MGYLDKMRIALKLLQLNEKITITLSVLAIVLSGISIYYQFLYSKKELLLTVTEINLDTKSKVLALDIALINSGTEPLLITSYELGIKHTPNSGLRILGKLDDLTNSIGKTFIVKPAEIKLKALSVDLSNQDINLLQAEQCLPYDLFIHLIIVGNDGKYYSDNTQLASIKKGQSSSLIEIYRDIVNIFNSKNLYREHNENYSVKGLAEYKNPIEKYNCSL